MLALPKEGVECRKTNWAQRPIRKHVSWGGISTPVPEEEMEECMLKCF